MQGIDSIGQSKTLHDLLHDFYFTSTYTLLQKERTKEKDFEY